MDPTENIFFLFVFVMKISIIRCGWISQNLFNKRLKKFFLQENVFLIWECFDYFQSGKVHHPPSAFLADVDAGIAVVVEVDGVLLLLVRLILPSTVLPTSLLTILPLTLLRTFDDFRIILTFSKFFAIFLNFLLFLSKMLYPTTSLMLQYILKIVCSWKLKDLCQFWESI